MSTSLHGSQDEETQVHDYHDYNEHYKFLNKRHELYGWLWVMVIIYKPVLQSKHFNRAGPMGKNEATRCLLKILWSVCVGWDPMKKYDFVCKSSRPSKCTTLLYVVLFFWNPKEACPICPFINLLTHCFTYMKIQFALLSHYHPWNVSLLCSHVTCDNGNDMNNQNS